MIGEKGINVSGGQKSRIALARALYSNSDIMLLDDILSAVDIHVGKRILKECLCEYKKNSTRILVTHALYYMKYMDLIIMLDKGEIVEMGDYEAIHSSKRFQEIYEKFKKPDEVEEEKELDATIAPA